MPAVNLSYQYTEEDIIRIISALLAKQGLKLAKHGTVVNADDSLYLIHKHSITISTAQVIAGSELDRRTRAEAMDASMDEILALCKDKDVIQHDLFFPLNFPCRGGQRHWILAEARFNKISVIQAGAFDPLRKPLPVEFLRSLLNPLFRKHLKKLDWLTALYTAQLSYPCYAFGCRQQSDATSCGVHLVDMFLELVSKTNVSCDKTPFSESEVRASRISHIIALNDTDFEKKQAENVADVRYVAREAEKIEIIEIFMQFNAYIESLDLEQQKAFKEIATIFVQNEEKLAKSTAIDRDEYDLNVAMLKIWFTEHKQALEKQDLMTKFFKPESDVVEFQDKGLLISVLQRFLLVANKKAIETKVAQPRTYAGLLLSS